MMSHQIQFVINSTSSTTLPQSVARSHAARSAHARERRLRTLQYQAQKNRAGHKEPEILDNSESLPLPGCGPNNLLTYHRRDPFMSGAKLLRPFEQMLFDHYVTVIIPLMRCNTYDIHFYQHMAWSWVPFALAEASLLDTLLLAACRHLVACHEAHRQEEQELFSRLAFQYKLHILQSLREAISAETPQFTDSTVIKAIMLAYDELWVRDETMMEQHVEGAVRMVTLKGGPKTLGLDGLVERLLFNLVNKVNKETGLSVTSPWDPRIASVEMM